jgi:ADP-heptose:LPS heptosyltransferase
VRLPTLVALRALKLGDLLVATPALRGIARAFPLHRRVLYAPLALEPILPLIGGVDEVVDTPDLRPLRPQPDRPDIAVNLHGRGPVSTRLLASLQPHRLIAFGADGNIPWDETEHERVRWCRLLESCGIPTDHDDLALRRTRLPSAGCFAGATIVHPGASSEARRWPADRFAGVARSERERGRPVVVTGTADEAAVAAAVVEQAGLHPCANLAGRTSLTQLAAIVAGAGVVCSGDTGVAHLATGFGTPSVVLFGPVSPEQWGPPPTGGLHQALWKGRTGDPHGATVDPGLLDITVGEVVAALQSRRPRDMVGS